jgi:hypothetical protein
MRGRIGRQTRRRTRRELVHSLSRRGRKWLDETWAAAQDELAQLRALSPLSTEVGKRLVETDAGAEGIEEQQIQDAWFEVMKAGYASRVVLVEPTDQPSLDLASLGADRSLDPVRTATDPAAVDALADPVRRLAVTDFASVMSLPPEVWSAYVAKAANKLQGELTSGPVTWRVLDRDRIERMLRYGYVLGSLDEATGGSPVPAEDAGSDPGQSES